jgi:hypothetical protein
MNTTEESRYWMEKSNEIYSQAMDMLEKSDTYWAKAIEIAKTDRKES